MRWCISKSKLVSLPFTPKRDQFQISPAASEILHHIVWRTWLFIAYSDETWLYNQILIASPIQFYLEGWENVLFLNMGVKGLTFHLLHPILTHLKKTSLSPEVHDSAVRPMQPQPNSDYSPLQTNKPAKNISNSHPYPAPHRPRMPMPSACSKVDPWAYQGKMLGNTGGMEWVLCTWVGGNSWDRYRINKLEWGYLQHCWIMDGNYIFNITGIFSSEKNLTRGLCLTKLLQLCQLCCMHFTGTLVGPRFDPWASQWHVHNKA